MEELLSQKQQGLTLLKMCSHHHPPSAKYLSLLLLHLFLRPRDGGCSPLLLPQLNCAYLFNRPLQLNLLLSWLFFLLNFLVQITNVAPVPDWITHSRGGTDSSPSSPSGAVISRTLLHKDRDEMSASCSHVWKIKILLAIGQSVWQYPERTFWQLRVSWESNLFFKFP